MKYLLTLLLCFFASNAFASKPDSGICPWKMPFTINISAKGNLHSHNEFIPTHGPTQYNDNGTGPDSETLSITIDSGHCSMKNDTLQYDRSYLDTVWHASYWSSATIIFAHGIDSIITIRFSGGEQVNGPSPQSFSDQYQFQAFSLLYDDSSIFSADSNFSDHHISVGDDQLTIDSLDPRYGIFGWFYYKDFSATSATLSGIFLPTTFLNPQTGRIPWKLPLQINIRAIGIDTTPGASDTLSFSFTGANPSYSSRDTLEFYSSTQSATYPFQSNTTTSIVFAFVPGEDSIRTLSIFTSGTTTATDGNSQQTWQGETNFQISSLAYNDTTIYTEDSSFCNHDISLTSYETTNSPHPNTVLQNFTATSVSLSGIFLSKTYLACESSAVQTNSGSSLRIFNSNGSIACSFDVSDHSRDLEIFSPLVIREASFPIPAGQTGASLPHLPPGFYFVRLEGAMAKVYIAE